MKRNVMLSLIAAFVLLACGSTPCLADGPIPICYPGHPCAAKLFDGGGGPEPICFPGHPCAVKLFDGGGGPTPICYPGHPCITR
jgi:hypothetical protein